VNQVEALHIAIVSLGIRARSMDETPNYHRGDRLWEAARVLQRIEALYDPDSDAWKLP
jgi:hypothetical protein